MMQKFNHVMLYLIKCQLCMFKQNSIETRERIPLETLIKKIVINNNRIKMLVGLDKI